MLSPTSTPRAQPAPWLEWLRAGFFLAFGAGLLILLALVARKLFLATLSVISPFIVGAIIALVLDPFVDRLEKRGVGRLLAVALIFSIVLLVTAAFLGFLIPALVSQASQLAENGPTYVERVRVLVNDYLAEHRRLGTIPLPQSFDAILTQLSERTATLLRSSSGGIAAFLLGSIGLVLDTVITLIVAFYLLLDVDRLRARLIYFTPEPARGPLKRIAGDIGAVFSKYLRGLTIVCAQYGIATALMFYGLALVNGEMAHYALIVGVAAGLLYAVPYIGALATSFVTFLIAFAVGGLGFGALAVGLTLALNQVFDNVVTPRVIGRGVGLHPVATLFALTLGGALFGLLGMVLSVPLAASVQVILFAAFPKLSTPTPDEFLRQQGVKACEPLSAPEVMEDREHEKPEHSRE